MKHKKSNRGDKRHGGILWRYVTWSSLLIIAGFILAFNIVNQQNTGKSSAATGTLVFDDEFNGSAGSAPDPSKWVVMGGSKPPRWGVECFVDDRSHIYLDGSGHLVEKATYNPSGVPCSNGSGNYESGGMDTGSATGGLFDFKYGTAVASIKVPCQSGLGIWPAFWADGPSWPKGGEIDFLEVMKGYNGTNAKQSLHGPTTSGGHWNIGNNNIASTQWCKQYHTYGVIWSSKKIEFTIDGNVTHTDTPSNMQSGWTWPFDSYDERLLLDLQVGGSGGTIDNSTFPQSMLVDYVRVYQDSGTPVDTTPPSVSISSPSGGTNVNGTINVSVNASDNTGVSKVTLYVDGNPIASDTSTPYSFSLDTTSYADGNHSLYATADDIAGNQGKSSTITINIANTQGSGGSSSGGSSGSGSSSSGSSSSSGVITITASSPASQPKVSVDGKPSGATINTHTLTNGTHVIAVTQNGITRKKTITVKNPWYTNVVNHLLLHPVAYSIASISAVALIPITVWAIRVPVNNYMWRRHIRTLRYPKDPDIRIG